jgi:phospho-N-acetylmuramoyl-pentapeptide-transferase
MLIKLNSILVFGLIAFFGALVLYPWYIELLKHLKAGKQLRQDSVTWDKAPIFNKLHGHKAGTPTMGGGLMLIIMIIMIGASYVLQYYGYINNTLITRQETYILLFAFFSMGSLGFIDDYLNIQWKGGIKGLTAHMKMIWMVLFSWFISYWFYWKLGIDYFTLWPFAGEVHLGILSALLTFFFTITIVNAINITDGLDGLVWGLLLIILLVLGVMTFLSSWFIATTLIAIVIGCLLAFLWFNINPAKIFFGDSWALAVWWFIATLVYLLNIRFGIIVPFLLLFLLFWIEIGSSFLQILSKKFLHRKLFAIAPFHHLLEHRGQAEHTIVMKFWLIQGVLAGIALIGILYQL